VSDFHFHSFPGDEPTHSDDHDFVDDNDEQNSRPWETGSEKKVQEQEWCGDDPMEALESLRPPTYTATNQSMYRT